MKQQFRDTLKPLSTKIKVKEIASYDIETETQTGYNNFLIGGFIDSRGIYKSFKDKDKMIEYMLKHTTKDTMIYATNNKFDYSALFKHTKEFLKEEVCLRGGLLMHCKHKHMHFYDTLSYNKASVEKMGEMLGKQKLKFNLSKNKINMSKGELRRLIAYNKRDCEITREFMIGLQQVINDLGGELKITIGSTAMDLFRRKYLKENIHHEYIIDKQFEDGTTVKEFIFKSYHGGRTEMFKRGQDNNNEYYRYDFNSLYPSVMLESYPKPSTANMSEDIYGRLNKDSIEKYDGICECEVIVPYMYYPILCTYQNNKLIFPIGRFRDIFTYAELRLAISKGVKILKIYKTVTYTQKITPFKEWVTNIYNLRLKYAKENNTIYKEICKLLLNNLYGKFGQHNLKDVKFYRENERDDTNPEQDGVIFETNSGFGYKEIDKEAKQVFILPIFATYTTAYARIKLYNALNNLKGIYCDTDSIFTTKKIKTSLALGELKLEGVSIGLNIVKQKHYKETNKDTGITTYKIKGLSMSKNIFEREQEFDSSITGKKIKQMRIVGIKDAIRTGKQINELIYTTKKFDLRDDKRVWIKPYDKNRMRNSEPIILGFPNASSLMEFYEKCQ